MRLKRQDALKSRTPSLFFIICSFLFLVQISTMDAVANELTQPQYLHINEVKKHLANGKIEWHIVQGSGQEMKRLRPVGLLSKKCISKGNENASMELVAHPNDSKKDILNVYVHLTSDCQQIKLDGNSREAINFQDTNSRINKASAISLSTLFNNLTIPAHFSGKIQVCAVSSGDEDALEERTSCEEIALIDKSDKGFVDTKTNRIIGAGEKLQNAVAKANEEKEAKEKQEKTEQDKEAQNIIMRVVKATCSGNLSLANSQIRKLADFGIQVSDLMKKNTQFALDMLQSSVKNAKSQEEMDEVLTKFQKAENYFRDEKAKGSFKKAWMEKSVELVENEIDGLTSMDSSDARKAKQTIADLGKRTKELYSSSKERGEKNKAVDGAFKKLVDKAMSLGDKTRAMELAQEGAQKTTGEYKLGYIRAERTILQSQFKNCVNRAADKNTGLDKCEKIRNKAHKVHKEYAEEAEDIVSEEKREKIKEEGEELFGRSYGIVKTPFGWTVQQPTYGEFDMFQRQTIQEIYMNQLYRMNGMGGMGMQMPGMQMSGMMGGMQMPGMGGFRQNIGFQQQPQIGMMPNQPFMGMQQQQQPLLPF